MVATTLISSCKCVCLCHSSLLCLQKDLLTILLRSHFEPTGRKLGDTSKENSAADEFFPPYLLPDSPELDNWKARNPHGWNNKPAPSAPIQQVKGPEGHHAAATGDVDRLNKLAQSNRKALHAKDKNGWTPLHEAVRADNAEVVQLLIEKHGADKNARVGRNGEGPSALGLAKEYLNVGAATTRYLMSIGAEDPDL